MRIWIMMLVMKKIILCNLKSSTKFATRECARKDMRCMEWSFSRRKVFKSTIQKGNDWQIWDA